MLGAPPVGQPAHDGAVLAQHLHAIDAEIVVVLPLGGGPLGHHQGPGDQRRRLAGPAGLDGQLGQVDLVAGPDDLLHRRLLHRGRAHGHDGLGQRQHVQSVLQAPGRFGAAQEGQQFADFAQVRGCGPLAPFQRDPHGHPLDRAKQVDQAGHGRALAIGADDVLKQDRRPALFQQAAVDFGHLQNGGDGLRHPHQFAGGFQLGDEFPQRPIGHEPSQA